MLSQTPGRHRPTAGALLQRESISNPPPSMDCSLHLFLQLQPALLGLPVQQPAAEYSVEGLRLSPTHSRVWGALGAVDGDQHALVLQALLNAAGQAVLGQCGQVLLWPAAGELWQLVRLCWGL